IQSHKYMVLVFLFFVFFICYNKNGILILFMTGFVVMKLVGGVVFIKKPLNYFSTVNPVSFDVDYFCQTLKPNTS
ncbi:MAG: hypothetical protein ACE1ZQ_06920, partial [Ignavibacteriaceae bacterium]